MIPLILTIVSDSAFRLTLCRHLEQAGWQVQGSSTLAEGIAQARRATPSVILLDGALVEDQARAIYRELHWQGSPLVLLMAPDGTTDAVTALEEGADDYVGLPCSMAELEARITALLRRRGETSGVAATEIRLGDLTISLPSRQVMLRGSSVSLAPKEFDILAALAKRAERVVTRDELVRLVWSQEKPIKRQTLDVYLFSLRAKIEDQPSRPARLLTVRGVGYRLIASGGAGSACCGA